MNRILLPLALFLAIGSSSVDVSAQTEIPTLPPGDVATVQAIESAIEAFERVMSDGETTCPLAPKTLHPMAELQQLLSAEWRNSVIVQDGWGQPLQFWCADAHWAVLSVGKDGRAKTDYRLLPEFGATGDDFLVIDGDFRAAPEEVMTLLEFNRQGETFRNLVSLATVFYAYHIDNGFYPGEELSEMQPIERVQTLVQPIYIRTLPLTDGWGHPFLFWTDGQNYRLVSPGRDGLLETSYFDTPGAGPYDPLQFDADLVMSHGEFERWPEFSEEKTAVRGR